MTRRALVLGLPIALVAGASGAWAGEEAPRKEVGQYIDIQPVAMPIVVDGRLANYVFVYLRLNLVAGADTARWRAKEPYFRDALVRMGHETPFLVPGQPDKIDAARLTAEMSRRASAITGPGVIRSVVVTQQVASRHGRPSPG